MSSLLSSYGRITRDNGRPFTATLTSTGNNSGDINMNVDGSSVPVEFWYAPLENETIVVRGLTITVGFIGATKADEYGNVLGPLPNGVRVYVERDGIKTYSNLLLRNNSDLARGSISLNVIAFSNSNLIVYQQNFGTFSDSYLLKGDTNDRFGIEIRDDLTSLDLHECEIRGGSYEKLPV